MMMNEEKYIRNKAGQRTPFQVPDGYFESFTDQMLTKLPEQAEGQMEGNSAEFTVGHHSKGHARILLLRPWLAVAACTMAAIFSVSIYLSNGSSQSGSNVAVKSEQTAHRKKMPHQTYMEAAANYTMTDNDDIYACLSDD